MHAFRDKTENVNELVFYERNLRDGRSAGNAMRTERFKLNCFFVRADESRDRNGREQCDLRRGLRNRNVPNVADLAMLLVGFVAVPVPGRLHGKQTNGKNQGYGQ
jgi:hypothetical protein